MRFPQTPVMRRPGSVGVPAGVLKMFCGRSPLPNVGARFIAPFVCIRIEKCALRYIGRDKSRPYTVFMNMFLSRNPGHRHFRPKNKT